MVVGYDLYRMAAKDICTTGSLFYKYETLCITSNNLLKIARAESNHPTPFSNYTDDYDSDVQENDHYKLLTRT
jgi:hypothetical protein